MGILLGLFAIESFILLLMKGTCRWQVTIDNSGKNSLTPKYSKKLMILFAFFAIAVAGLRNKFWDTSDYRYMYDIIGSNLANVTNGSVLHVEKGYLFFTYLLNLISHNSQFLFIVSALITNGLFIYTIYKESEDVPFSLYVYFCTMYLSTMNGLRQILAASIVYTYGLKWIRDRNFKSNIAMLACILLMSTFHRSVLICIPIYWIATGKRFNTSIKFILLLSILLLAIPGLSETVIGVLGGELYSDYQNVSAAQGILRFIISSVPFVLCIISNYKYNLDDVLSTEQNWMFNLTLIGFCFNLLALRMVYYARINMYFGISDIIMLPTYIDLSLKKGNSKIVKPLAVLLYGIFYYFSLLASGSFVTGFSLVI